MSEIPEVPDTDSGGLTTMLLSLWNHLSSRRHRQLVLLLALVFLSALADVITLGAVLPFISVLTTPERVYSYPLVSSAADSLGIGTAGELVLPLTLVFVATALLAGAIRLLSLWATVRLAVAIGADLSADVYRRTLHQPYSTHIARNSSGLISGLTTKLDVVVDGVILSTLHLVGSLSLIVAVVTALVLIDPTVAAIGLLSFGSSYVAVTLVFRHKLMNNSFMVSEGHTRMVKCLQEGMGGIRDILMGGTQSFFATTFGAADRQFRRARGNTIFISSSPRFVMEALGIILIALLAFGMSRQAGGLTTGLPTLAALAIGGQRLLPALQQGYAGWTGLIGNRVLAAEVTSLLNQPTPNRVDGPPPETTPFAKSLELDSVSFRYAADGPLVLENVTIEIQHGATVGLVGSTGSGKSTVIDLLMGLLEPTSGTVLVDGTPITGAQRQSWQQGVAYVPQTIFLTDGKITDNIAFGIPQDEVEMARVRASARAAAIADFIESRPDGYDTRVGERGIQLSGGQRQRIGIARAFYKGASVLVFDEAMSALDPETERMVVDSINHYGNHFTVIMVSHRLRTVENCDIIYQFANGCLVAQGTLEELTSNNSMFRQMADLVDF